MRLAIGRRQENEVIEAERKRRAGQSWKMKKKCYLTFIEGNLARLKNPGQIA